MKVLARLDNKEYLIDDTAKAGFMRKGYDIYDITGTVKINEDTLASVAAEYEAYKLVNAPKALSVAAVAGVTAPVKGAAAKLLTTAHAERKGIVNWAPALPADGKFAASTVYVATITLIPSIGYTETGATANLFTVAGAVATNPANSGVITATFPATGA